MAEIKCLNPWDIQSKHIVAPDGISEALYAGECRWAGGEHYICYEKPKTKNTVVFVPYGSRLGFHVDSVASTMSHIDYKFPQCVCYEKEYE